MNLENKKDKNSTPYRSLRPWTLIAIFLINLFPLTLLMENSFSLWGLREVAIIGLALFTSIMFVNLFVSTDYLNAEKIYSEKSYTTLLNLYDERIKQARKMTKELNDLNDCLTETVTQLMETENNCCWLLDIIKQSEININENLEELMIQYNRQNKKLFTRREVGLMTPQQFAQNEKVIMDQFRRGLIK